MNAAPECLPKQASAEQILLRNVRAFLQHRLLHLAPDAVLTHAWAEFYRMYTRMLRRVGDAFGFGRHDVDDLLQEVWTRVIVSLSEFDRDDLPFNLRAWLYTLIRNKARDFLRRKARRPAALEDGTNAKDIPDPSPSPAAQWVREWDRQLIHLALAEVRKKVSPMNHRLVCMRWLEERPLAEVAKTLNLSRRQVVDRQKRTFRKLRAILAVYRGEAFARSQGPAA